MLLYKLKMRKTEKISEITQFIYFVYCAHAPKPERNKKYQNNSCRWLLELKFEKNEKKNEQLEVTQKMFGFLLFNFQ